MITATSTPAEVIAHHRKCIEDFTASLATERDAAWRFWIERRIRGHRERLAKAEAAL